MMVGQRAICQAVLLLVLIVGVMCKGGRNPKTKGRLQSIPLWKSLMIHHHRWAGYYVHDQTRYMCAMFVHSVDSSDQGTVLISFTTEGFHIEMTGGADENDTITFEEIHTWNKSGHFQGHTNVVFQGAFVHDYGYYKFAANVSSQEAHNYGSVTLIPQGRSLNDGKQDDSKSPSLSLAMAIVIPMFLGTVVLTLAIFIIIWAVRKGYLRHIPWAYKTFHNPRSPKSDVEMEGDAGDAERTEKPQTQSYDHSGTGTVTLDGVDGTAVHM